MGCEISRACVLPDGAGGTSEWLPAVAALVLDALCALALEVCAWVGAGGSGEAGAASMGERASSCGGGANAGASAGLLRA
jgi:hypothetical protein